MGTILSSLGLLQPGERPFSLTLTHASEVTAVHRAYVDAGALVVTANTFSANARTLRGEVTVDQLYGKARECLAQAGAPFAAADMGPVGELLEPFGDLQREEASALYREQARAALHWGYDLIILETMSDLAETELAVEAIREECELPLFVSLSFGQGGRTFMGASPEETAQRLGRMPIQALGANCSLGPDSMVPILQAMSQETTLPLIAKPNAGLPKMINGATTYDLEPQVFAESMMELLEHGATILGGCCGTTPAHIEALATLVNR